MAPRLNVVLGLLSGHNWVCMRPACAYPHAPTNGNTLTNGQTNSPADGQYPA